jgi:serine/threonine protein kinase/Tfp pilus assembly protein PilF
MQPVPPEISTCPNCGAVLEETSGGRVGCMSCLLRAGIGSEQETLQGSTPHAFEGGVRFGVYEIDCHADGSLYELGRGAMGVTYRATDTSLQRKVALKIIKIDIAERSADARERFTREARAAAALRHENIATVHQFGMRLETGQYFYAMELIDGETLEERVRRAGPLDARATIGIAEQVTSALAAAEKHGLVHRDLKPANLMLVSPDGETAHVTNNTKLLVKIIDFGLAKAVHTATDPKSLTHDRFVGTPAFASPEQFEHSALDVRSDIYSLGETLWFALTGKIPFAGRNLEEIRRAQKSNVLPIEQLKAAHVPHRVKSLLESMLAFEPASRPGTGELAARLQRCSPEARSARRTRAALAAAALLILGLCASFIFLSLRTQHLPSNLSIPEKSIAVLPFENLSADPENAFFADGVQDEILNNLAKIADLKVISRTSVMQYKSGAKRNLRQIANELSVAHVIEGSVQRAGNRVRVSAQLIDAGTDKHLWAESYDRPLDDVFAIQSDIAKAIAGQLQAKLSPAEKAAIQQPPTRNLIAYDRYVRAEKLWSLPTTYLPQDMREVIRLLDQAVSHDPTFLLAYCELARAHAYVHFLGIDHTPARVALAKKARDAALQLGPDRGEPHLAAAWVAYWCYRDYETALSEVATARSGLPNDAAVFLITGSVARRQGHWEECTRNLERAVEVDPRNVWLLTTIAQTYQCQRRFSEAAAAWDRVLAIAPGDPSTRAWRGLVDLESRADTRPAYETIREVVMKDPSAVEAIAEQSIYFALCRRDAAEMASALASVAEEGIIPWNVRMPRSFFEGLAARVRNDAIGAETAFTAARVELEKIVREQPDNAQALCVLGMTDAALGRRDDALREGRRAVELLPVTKDALAGAAVLTNLAITYAWAGEKDLAINQLEEVVRIPSPVSYGQLRLHPFWDPLRGDPRFEKIVASLAAEAN